MTFHIAEVSTEEERKEVLALWGRNLASGKEAASEARFAWKYRANPHGEGTVWSLRAEGGGIVGAAGLGRNRFHMGERIVAAGQAVDLAVDPDHRTAGPALALQRVVTSMMGKNGVAFLYGFPNALAEPVLRRAGYRSLGFFERWSKPLRIGSRVASRLRWGPAARAVARVADGSLRLVARETYYRRPGGLLTHTQSGFDRRFDELWETASRSTPIIAERNASSLEWRFASAPFENYRVFLLLSEGGDRLLAYVVYRVWDRFARMADFFAAEARTMVTLFSEFALAMRQAGCESISAGYLGSPAVLAALRGAGFRRRSESLAVLLYAPESAELPAPSTMFDSNAWHLTDLDRDV